MTPGELLRDARRRHAVSQRRLAVRAGTTQSAISRIENDQVSPTVATLTELLRLLGEELELSSSAVDFGHDRTLLQRNLRLTPEQRVRQGVEFANFVLRNRAAAARSAF